MIKIRTPNLDKLANEFAERIMTSAQRRYHSKYEKTKRRKFAYIRGLDSGKKKCSLAEFLEKPLVKKILKIYIAQPSQLEREHNSFETYLKSNYPHSMTTIENVFFSYDGLISCENEKERHSHWLIRNVNVGVCPYCNRNFVQTHHAAQLDHFYPKSKGIQDAKTKKEYRYLKLSFYNLIPCCYQCNHEKSTETISVNPYEKGFSEDSKFKIENIEELLLRGLLNDKNKKDWNIRIDLQPNEKIHNKAFKLEDVYEQHKDIVEELVQKAYSYQSGYYDGLIQTFAEMGLKGNEIQTLIFGTPIQEEDLGKRPLSKLTKDVLDQLEIY